MYETFMYRLADANFKNLTKKRRGKGSVLRRFYN